MSHRQDSRPTTTTDDEIRERIKAKKAARKRPANYAPFRNTLRKLLGKMKAGKVYSLSNIELFIVKSGGSFLSAGPATSYGVREGYLDRVAKGQYTVTGKKMEG